MWLIAKVWYLLVSPVLCLLFVGVTAVICVGQAFYRPIVDTDYRKNLFAPESKRRGSSAGVG